MLPSWAPEVLNIPGESKDKNHCLIVLTINFSEVADTEPENLS